MSATLKHNIIAAGTYWSRLLSSRGDGYTRVMPAGCVLEPFFSRKRSTTTRPVTEAHSALAFTHSL